MDFDSDVPLSNLVIMDYLRREITKFERLIAEKTAQVPPLGPSAAAAGSRLITLQAAGTVDSLADATTPWSSSNRGGPSTAPQTDVPE